MNRQEHVEAEIQSEKIACVLQGVLAYEFRRYYTRMRMNKNMVVREALKEYLGARGVNVE